ncbi:magnesium transporter MgtC [Siphonobacter sp. SORGH_AS_0500]|uniref:MgtC/SapB family protein n=1 Tax=Siphonobacter sp. SORGH_AS_0500 TaxID=1864824 RepID=UPI000CC8EC24|nr:MgtC/SapB family protein [Siphonobacter sp. SORGH_AS_0500]PKK37042.1 magnesium transporter MgtC [Siphonobacter sp. SORGH_AS_0500]
MIEWTTVVTRIAVAALCGGLVGMERERKEWTAGLRTHMMVCVGSCLAMMVSTYGFEDVRGVEHVSLDPSRVAAQVVSGIGFIGAGTILFLRNEIIRGLTTAAGLWTVSAVGLAAGGGMYFAAFLTTITILFILLGLKPLQKLFFTKHHQQVIKIKAEAGPAVLDQLQQVLTDQGVTISYLSTERKSKEVIIYLKIKTLASGQEMFGLIRQIQTSPLVKDVVWHENG